MALIVLCRRHGVEFTPAILQYFFMPLLSANNLLSLRPRRNRVVLFDPPPNKLEWKTKWVGVESRIGFPIRPLIGHCTKWNALPSNVTLSVHERALLDKIAAELGTNPVTQSKFYHTADLLSRESLAWCGIGLGLEGRKAELGFEEEPEYPSWTLHPGRVFSTECAICQAPESAGC